MSGGHFDYIQYRMEEVADEIDELIKENNSIEESDYFGYKYSNNFPEEIIERFKVAVHTIRQAQEMAQRVDWLVSGDDGEESFMSRWDAEVRPCHRKANKVEVVSSFSQQESVA